MKNSTDRLSVTRSAGELPESSHDLSAWLIQLPRADTLQSTPSSHSGFDPSSPYKRGRPVPETGHPSRHRFGRIAPSSAMHRSPTASPKRPFRQLSLWASSAPQSALRTWLFRQPDSPLELPKALHGYFGSHNELVMGLPWSRRLEFTMGGPFRWRTRRRPRRRRVLEGAPPA